MNAIRFQELAALFGDVPRAPPKVQATVPISKYGSKLWSPDDLEVLVDLLVTITQDLQQKGTSPVVATVASKLGTCRCLMAAAHCMHLKWAGRLMDFWHPLSPSSRANGGIMRQQAARYSRPLLEEVTGISGS